MPWQIEREHVPAVIAEIAALQTEPRVVEARAMDEDHATLGGVELVIRRVGVDGAAADLQLHFCEARSARSRSSIRSCGSSSPIDKRTVPAVMPAFCRSASLMR